VSGMVQRESIKTTLSLFLEDEPAMNERDTKVMQMMDALNHRYGRGAIRLAAEHSDAWKPNQEKLSPSYTTKWNDIIEVKV